MAVEYTWDIQKVEILPSHTDGNNVTETDVIAVVHYEYRGLDSARTDQLAIGQTLPARGVVSGVRKLDTSDLSGFTSFANVTAVQAASWVEADFGAELDQLKLEVDKAVTENATPVQKTTVLLG